MNMFFGGDVVVVAEGAIVIQAFPIMGGDIPKSVFERVQQVNGVGTTFPMLVRFGSSNLEENGRQLIWTRKRPSLAHLLLFNMTLR
jgi:hypothetical protein